MADSAKEDLRLEPIVVWTEDGYPTDESLQRLREQLQQPNAQAMRVFYAALRDTHVYGRCGLETVEVRGTPMNLWGYHTGGWSGNEAIIGVLQESWLWGMLLERYDSGGHYYFQLPKWYVLIEEAR